MSQLNTFLNWHIGSIQFPGLSIPVANYDNMLFVSEELSASKFPLSNEIHLTPAGQKSFLVPNKRIWQGFCISTELLHNGLWNLKTWGQMLPDLLKQIVQLKLMGLCIWRRTWCKDVWSQWEFFYWPQWALDQAQVEQDLAGSIKLSEQQMDSKGLKAPASDLISAFKRTHLHLEPFTIA